MCRTSSPRSSRGAGSGTRPPRGRSSPPASAIRSPPSPGSASPSTTILGHVRAGTAITVHGDYDVDGVCATAILVRALRALGGQVDWVLPSRQDDGYGLPGHRRAPRRPGHEAADHRRLRDHGRRGGRRRPGRRARRRRHRPPRAARRRRPARRPDRPSCGLRLPVRGPLRRGRRVQARRGRWPRPRRDPRGRGRRPRPRRARHGRRRRPARGREPPPRARGPARACAHAHARACAR